MVEVCEVVGGTDDAVSELVDLLVGVDDVTIGAFDFVGDTGGGKEVLDGIGGESIDFDEAFVDESLQKEIDGTEGHVDLIAELTLCGVAVLVDVTEDGQFFAVGIAIHSCLLNFVQKVNRGVAQSLANGNATRSCLALYYWLLGSTCGVHSFAGSTVFSGRFQEVPCRHICGAGTHAIYRLCCNRNHV